MVKSEAEINAQYTIPDRSKVRGYALSLQLLYFSGSISSIPSSGFKLPR